MNDTVRKCILALLGALLFSCVHADAPLPTSNKLLNRLSLQYYESRNTPAMIIGLYDLATCAKYTGTWQGFLTDPTDLFGDGGPWPMTLSLYEQNGKVFGKITSYITGSAHFWADCDNGILIKIFWGKRGQCGGFSQPALLVSQNVLALELHTENAMMDADLLAFLQRRSSTYPDATPSPQDFNLGPVVSCHS